MYGVQQHGIRPSSQRRRRRWRGGSVCRIWSRRSRDNWVARPCGTAEVVVSISVGQHGRHVPLSRQQRAHAGGGGVGEVGRHPPTEAKHFAVRRRRSRFDYIYLPPNWRVCLGPGLHLVSADTNDSKKGNSEYENASVT